MSLGRKTDLFLIFKAKKIESLKTMFPKLLDNTSENKSLPFFYPLGSTSKINQNRTLGLVTFLMTSSYFTKFSEILMKFQFEIAFDVKNYFLLLFRFLKENLLEISNK